MLTRNLDDRTIVAGQINPEDVAEAAALGVTLIVNNRPDGEEPDQPSHAQIEAAARAAGIGYRYIPVGSSGLSAVQVRAMAEALEGSGGKVLAFCRSGTRSTYLWALARAQQGADAEELVTRAAEAGYDLGPVRPFMG